MRNRGTGFWRKETLVEGVRKIDIRDFAKKGFFEEIPGQFQVCRFLEGGKETSSFCCSLEGTGEMQSIRFRYSSTDWAGNKKDYNYRVVIDYTPCNYGGERPWFICPLVVDRRPCQRRCRILYLPPGAEYFGCRECHRLTYEARQKHKNQFYEGVIKPLNKLQELEDKFKNCNKPKDLRKLFRLHSEFKTGAAIFNQRRNAKVAKILKKAELLGKRKTSK